MTINQSSTKS